MNFCLGHPKLAVLSNNLIRGPEKGWLKPAVWVTLHPSWLSQLSRPQEVHVHTMTHLLLSNHSTLLGECEWNKKW